MGSVDRVEEAILGELGRRYELADVSLDSPTLELAKRLEPEHAVAS
jgi:hypothetical protein